MATVADKPQVSVIIVNWNGAHHLRICLPSLREQSCKPLEIIVVDNGSRDESAEIAQQYGARWLAVGKNAGLAPGLNRGAAVAGGDFLLFVNNDMRFDPNFVSTLLKPLEEDETIFATDGMQFNWDGTEKGHLALRMTRKKPDRSSAVEIVPGLYFFQQEAEEKSPVFMASAACMLARRTLFEKIGGFDDRLPLGYEDTEICWRAWLHGWKTVYVPNAVCWHRVGGSGRSIEGQLFNFRGILIGRLLLAMKFLPARYIVRTWLVSAAALARDLVMLRFLFAKDRVKVLAKSVALSGPLFRERKLLFEEAKIAPEKHLEHLLELTDQNARP
jgi:GT2 family glycosyltransferase